MSDIFFSYAPMEQEIEKKLYSLQMPTESLIEKLLSESLSQVLSNTDLGQLEKLISCLLGLPFDTVYESYFSHPVRVTAHLASEIATFDYDWAALALTHNIIELEMLTDDIRQFLSEKTLSRINTLTIDRSKERSDTYLSNFYDGICQNSNELMIFKTIDKLDNTLAWVLYDLPQYHGDIVLNHVCPKTNELNSQLSTYLENLTHYVARPDVRKKYEAQRNAR